MAFEPLGARQLKGLRWVGAAIALMLGGCAPEPAGTSVTATPPPPASPSIVTIDIQRPLYKPVILSEDRLRYVHDRIDELAAASKLAKLTSEAPNEVRIWRSVATFAASPGYETVGYIITSSQTSRCEIDYPPDGQPPFAGKCEIVPIKSSGFDSARFVEPLLPYANTDMGCGVMDGEWYELDIVHSGKRFVISASNPGSCVGMGAGPGSTEVSSLLEAVYRRR
jgi:hypothetical protein